MSTTFPSIVAHRTMQEAFDHLEAVRDQRPQSMVVYVLRPDAFLHETYSYECRRFDRALEIVAHTFWSLEPGTLVQFAWL